MSREALTAGRQALLHPQITVMSLDDVCVHDGPEHDTCQEDSTLWSMNSSRERCDGDNLAKGMPAGFWTAMEGTVQVWPKSEEPWHQHRQPG